MEIDKSILKEVIKATLFVSGDGIDIKEFADKFGFDEKEIRKQVDKLKEELSGEKGIHLIEFGNKVQLSSNPKYADFIASVLNPIREKALTKAAMQTLAIIAYKQPVTRLDIENIRGVGSDYAVQVLIEQNMIEVVGRKDVVGKPLLFGTTDEFLKRFDIESIDQLPNYEELLERIKLIKVEQEQKSDSLYKDFTLPDEEEIPEHLQGEGFEEISGEEDKPDILELANQILSEERQEETSLAEWFKLKEHINLCSFFCYVIESFITTIFKQQKSFCSEYMFNLIPKVLICFNFNTLL